MNGAWAALVRYLRDPLGMLAEVAATQGDVARLRVGASTLHLVSDPEAIRRILVRDARGFHKGRALQEARRLLGDGLLTSEGSAHLEHRRLLQPVFHRERIDAYGEQMARAAEAACARWPAGATIDVNDEMSRLTLAIVGRTLFDEDVESETHEVRAVLDAGMAVFGRFLIPGGSLLWHLPVPSTRRFLRTRARMDAYLRRLIGERRTHDGPGSDLLSLLVAARDGSRRLSDEEVRDEAITLILAGHETTAQALTWAWLLLARHPQAEARLHEELDRQLGARRPGAADVGRLPFARAVLAESMRLYPPVWALARRATVPYRLDGVVVPAGGVVVMSQYVVHRDARWFPEPERFLPERWLDTPRPEAQAAYFPFGGGSRLCIGERFAWMEGVLVLATIAQHTRLRVPGGLEPRLEPRFTLRPRGGLEATVERRASPGSQRHPLAVR